MQASMRTVADATTELPRLADMAGPPTAQVAVSNGAALAVEQLTPFRRGRSPWSFAYMASQGVGFPGGFTHSPPGVADGEYTLKNPVSRWPLPLTARPAQQQQGGFGLVDSMQPEPAHFLVAGFEEYRLFVSTNSLHPQAAARPSE